MILCILLSRGVHLLWLIPYFCFVCGNEAKEDQIREMLDRRADEVNRQLEFIDFCKSVNITILAYPDSKMNTVTVFFELTDFKFKDCYAQFVIFLEKRRRIVNSKRILYKHDTEKKASHIFENVTCGIYEVVIQPWYNDRMYARLKFRYPKLINMSSNDCFNNFPESPSSKLIPPSQSIEKEMIILTAVVSVISVLVVIGLVYYCRSGIQNKVNLNSDPDPDAGVIGVIRRIHVYIFHYYDRQNVVERRVGILRNFLVNSSYFSSVRVIEGELPEILRNPNDWLNEALEEEGEDGSIIKIVIIDSKEENEEEEHEIENSLYIQAIETLDNDKCRSRTGYDTVFVARLRGTHAYSERIKRIVRGHRYRIPEHLIDLCVNLCSGSGLDVSEVERNVTELLLRHPVRYLGLVEHI